MEEIKMKKRIFSVLAIGVFALTLMSCGGDAGDEDQIRPFLAANTTGSIEFEEVNGQLAVYYVDDMERNVQFDLKDIAHEFNVGSNKGRYESFKLIDGVLCYPNNTLADSSPSGDYFWRPILVSEANGEKIIEINENHINEYNEYIIDYGIKDLSKLYVGGYVDIILKIDFAANGGDNLGLVEDEYRPDYTG